jgi:hypothetical protein
MPLIKPFKSIDPTLPGFKRSLKKANNREAIEKAIVDLLLDPIPGHLDFKKLSGYRNPSIFTITICGNHSHKLSMEIKDGVAILRRVGTHKEIDNNP